MIFEHFRVLWLAAVLMPLLALFLWATWRKRQALIKQFVQHKLLAELSIGASNARQKWRRVLLLLAVALLLLAVARPQWGFVWEETSQRGRDIVVAIDTSRSMLAEDIQPNRLARAKLAALDLMKLGQYDRFGLVAFAGTAFLQCPLTVDEEAFRQSVQILEPGILPQGGTAISAAIDAAREAFGSEGEDNHKVIVLFTDGEDHEEGVLDTVRRAAGDGVKIFTIGAGTPAGEVLRVRDERGNLVFVKDDSGNVVKSRLNEDLLRQIATAANGFYLPLNAANAMEVLYQKGLAPMAPTERSTKLMKKLNEQYYWPLAFSIILLIVEVLMPDKKRTKRRTEAGAPAPAATVALLLALLSAAEIQGTPSSAMRKYNNREFKGALAEYQELIAKNPNDPRLRYNAGAAAYQANKFDEALSQFQAAAASPDLDLQQQAQYNLGNTEFKLGESNSDPKERMASWERALQHYETALRVNANDPDSVFNRDLVKRKIEELKKQQQEQKDQQGQPNEDDKKDEQKQDEQKKDNQSDNQNKQDQKQQQEQKDNQKEGGDKQPQSKQEEQKQDEQKKQQQASNQKDEKKPEDSKASKSGGEKEGENNPESSEQGQYAQLGKMTPAQAKQLLDAQRGEEKALLFIPQDKKAAARDRVFKDW